MLNYERNIKHFFRVDIQLYQHDWNWKKQEIVWKLNYKNTELRDAYFLVTNSHIVHFLRRFFAIMCSRVYSSTILIKIVQSKHVGFSIILSILIFFCLL